MKKYLLIFIIFILSISFCYATSPTYIMSSAAGTGTTQISYDGLTINNTFVGNDSQNSSYAVSAISRDGKNLLFGGTNGVHALNISYSTDSGITKHITGYIPIVTSSSSPIVINSLYGIISDNQLNNAGFYIFNFSTHTAVRKTLDTRATVALNSICSSYDGKYILASTKLGAGTNPIGMISSDYGQTFTNISGINNVGSCAISDNGQYMYINQFKSDNFGVNFTANSYIGNNTATSGTGQFIVTESENNVCTGLKYSLDYGVTFTNLSVSSIFPTNCWNFQMLKDGSKFYIFGRNSVTSGIAQSTYNATTLIISNSTINVGSSFGVSDSSVNTAVSNTNFTISMYSTNTKTGGQTIFIYPFVKGGQAIGDFLLQSPNPTNYIAKACNYTEKILTNDTFNYGNISLNAWQGCQYPTGIFDTINNFSLWFNSSTYGCVSDLRKLLTTNDLGSDVVVSFDIRPKSADLFTQNITNFTVSLRDNLGRDLTPLLISFKESLPYINGYAGIETCIYAYDTSANPILLTCKNDSGSRFIHINEYIDFSSNSYTLSATIDNQNYLSTPLSTFTTGQQIGYFYINPVDNYNIGYFDNLLITSTVYPAFQLINGTFNNSGFQGQFLCDYTTQGKYKSRFFYTSDGSNTYNNYQDFNIESVANENIASGQASAATSGSNNPNSIFPNSEVLSSEQKLLRIIITMAATFILLFGLTLGLYLAEKDRIILLIGSSITGIIEFFWLLFFLIKGYIDILVLILIAIIGAGVIGIWFFNLFRERGSDNSGG